MYRLKLLDPSSWLSDPYGSVCVVYSLLSFYPMLYFHYFVLRYGKSRRQAKKYFKTSYLLKKFAEKSITRKKQLQNSGPQ